MQPAQDNNSQAALVIPNTSRVRQGALLANVTIAGIVLYVIIDVIAQALPPHYNPISQAESDLAVGPYGFLMTINFVLRGLVALTMLGALSREVAKQGLSRVGLVLVGIWGIGAFLLALFPTDVGASTTLHGKIHLLVALIAFVCAPVGELLLSLRLAADERWRALRKPALVISTLAIVALVLDLLVPFVRRMQDAFGLFERLFIGMVLLWMLVVAIRLRSRPASK